MNPDQTAPWVHIVCILYCVIGYQSTKADEKQMTIFVTGGKRVEKIVQKSFPSVRLCSQHLIIQGQVEQSVTCLTVDPGVTILILARSHTFVEIDREIISMVILFPSTDS